MQSCDKSICRWARLAALLLLMVLAACSSINEEMLVAPIDRQTATLTPSLAPIPTPDLTTILEDGPVAWVVQEHYPTEALIQWLLAAKVTSVDAQVVAAELRRAGWNGSESSGGGSAFRANEFLVMDLNGDNKEEWIVTIYLYPTTATWGRAGDLLILGDDGVRYRFLVSEDYYCVTECVRDYPYHFFASAPVVAAHGDMTGDGQPELIVYRNFGGAHTHTQNYFVISHHFGVFENLVAVPTDRFEWGDAVYYAVDSRNREVPTISMTYSELIGFGDVDGDGLLELSIHGGWHGSAGSGIQRTRSEIWSWNGESVALSQVDWDATEYRMHVLWEANVLYYAGRYPESRSLFLQVIEDESLMESPYGDGESHYHSERRFAAFRIILISLQTQASDEAVFWQEWLEENYPGSPITLAATRLPDEMEATGNLSRACDRVSDFLLQFEYPPVTGSLEGGLGYANPSLGAEDVCLIVEK